MVAGLATDYCVRETALDALRKGFETIVLAGTTRPVELDPGDGERAFEDIRRSGGIDRVTGALLTDQYELTMAASYHKHGLNGTATFDLFVRELPANRNFLVVAGIEDALDHLETLRFEADDIDYLRSLDLFEDDFLGYLPELRFTGEVWAMPEGEIFFGNEPMMSVTAPLIEAQIVETYLLNAITFPSSIASEGGAHPDRGRGPLVRRLLSPTRPWTAGRAPGGARLLHRWSGRDLERPGRPHLRAPALRDDGPLVRDDVRQRDRGVPHLRP